MKVGDLVKFHTEAWVFAHANRRYANPGVIIEDVVVGTRYRVLWADKKMTVENVSYLRLAGKKS